MTIRRGILFLLAALFWGMAVSTSPRVGATADERVHLVAGYSYWKFNDYRLQPENGNLAMRLEALPLLNLNLRFPPLEDAAFRQARTNDVGHDFLFGSGNPFTTMLRRARGMVALFGVLTLALVWGWTRSLFGIPAAWLAVTIAAFCPTLLAHSGLATSDAAITACLLAAITACWRLLHRATWPRLLLAAIAVAAALLAKFSSVLLAPMAFILLLLRWAQPTPFVLKWVGREHWFRGRIRIAVVTSALAMATGALALLLVWSAYGVRYRAFNPALTDRDSAPPAQWNPPLSSGPGGNPSTPLRVIAWARAHHLLPEAYLYGLSDSYEGSRGRRAFLMGETSTTGWLRFFPIAFLLKTPPTLLVLLIAGLTALALAHGAQRSTRIRRWPRRGWIYRAAPLVTLLLLYGGIALNTPLNIGHRHLLPLYPILYVVAGAAAGALVLTRRRVFVTAILAGVGVVHAADSWASRPFYLSYFTPWVGGPARGWHYLIDSSLDWGQGLPDLTTWIAAKESRGDRTPVFLTYFGTDSPEARHLPITRFGDLVTDLSPRAFPAQVRGGWFVISATHFQRVYLDLSGPWTPTRERRYGEVLATLVRTQSNLTAWTEAEQRSLGEAARDYEQLQFARLCHFLRDRAPDTIIADSLLVFRLSDAEVQQALYAPLEP